MNLYFGLGDKKSMEWDESILFFWNMKRKNKNNNNIAYARIEEHWMQEEYKVYKHQVHPEKIYVTMKWKKNLN